MICFFNVLAEILNLQLQLEGKFCSTIENYLIPLIVVQFNQVSLESKHFCQLETSLWASGFIKLDECRFYLVLNYK